MADLSEIQASQSVKVAGAGPTSGVESNYLDVDSNGYISVKINDASGTALTSQANGSQRALDVGINVAGVQIDPRSIRALTASDVISAAQSGTWTVQPGNTANTTAWLVKDNSLGTVAAGTAGTQSSLAGGVFNTSLPTLTNGQQSAIQFDSSGRLIIAPLTSSSTTTAAEDHNYGTVGANTLRVASQIGSATGAALFGAGTTTTQVLRVVLPTDQTAIPVTQSGTWTVQPGNTQNTTAWLTQDAANGPVTPGTVAAKSELIGGQYNSTLPTLTTGQQAAVQVDNRGRLLTNATLTAISGGLTPSFSSKVRAVITNTIIAVTNSVTYTTIYSYSGTGKLIGFNVEFNNVSVVVKLVVDGEIIFDGFDIATLNGFLVTAGAQTRRQNGVGLVTESSSLDFSLKYPITFASNVTISARLTSGAISRNFQQGIFYIAQET